MCNLYTDVCNICNDTADKLICVVIQYLTGLFPQYSTLVSYSIVWSGEVLRAETGDRDLYMVLSPM